MTMSDTQEDSHETTGKGTLKVLSELAWPCQHLDLILLASTIPYFSFFIIVVLGSQQSWELRERQG